MRANIDNRIRQSSGEEVVSYVAILEHVVQDGSTLNCPGFAGDSDHGVPARARGLGSQDASYSAGGTYPRAPYSLRLLNQSTHSSVARSSSGRSVSLPDKQILAAPPDPLEHRIIQ